MGTEGTPSLLLLSLHCWPPSSFSLLPLLLLLPPLPSSFLFLPPPSSSSLLLFLVPFSICLLSQEGPRNQGWLFPRGMFAAGKNRAGCPLRVSIPHLALLGHKRCKGCPDLPAGHVDHMESQGEGGREHGADRWACEWAPEFPLCLGCQPLSRSTPTLISCQLTPTPASAVASAAPRACTVERLWESLGLSQKG